MTSAQVVETSVTNNSSFQNYPHPDDHTIRTKKIEVGFCTENTLKDACAKALKVGCSISDKQLMSFRLQCKSFLIAIIKKLILKYPLSYSFVRNMVALDPREIAANPNICRGKFKRILTVLVNLNKVRDENCDNVLQQ